MREFDLLPEPVRRVLASCYKLRLERQSRLSSSIFGVTVAMTAVLLLAGLAAHVYALLLPSTVFLADWLIVAGIVVFAVGSFASRQVVSKLPSDKEMEKQAAGLVEHKPHRSGSWWVPVQTLMEAVEQEDKKLIHSCLPRSTENDSDPDFRKFKKLVRQAYA